MNTNIFLQNITFPSLKRLLSLWFLKCKCASIRRRRFFSFPLNENESHSSKMAIYVESLCSTISVACVQFTEAEVFEKFCSQEAETGSIPWWHFWCKFGVRNSVKSIRVCPEVGKRHRQFCLLGENFLDVNGNFICTTSGCLPHLALSGI